MITGQDSTPITKTLITNDQERMNFLPKLFGNYFVQGESLVYNYIRRFCSDYCGGFWNFFSLSNGSGYMALDSQEPMEITIDMNQFQAAMSPEAAGIVVTYYVLGNIGFHLWDKNQDAAEPFFQRQRDLGQYARTLPEWELIQRAID